MSLEPLAGPRGEAAGEPVGTCFGLFNWVTLSLPHLEEVDNDSLREDTGDRRPGPGLVTGVSCILTKSTYISGSDI